MMCVMMMPPVDLDSYLYNFKQHKWLHMTVDSGTTSIEDPSLSFSLFESVLFNRFAAR